jgi:hypothetical protein
LAADTEAWLFVREKESVRVIKLAMARTLLVCGPGPSEKSHRFETDERLEEFRRSHEQQLRADGWVLHFTSERRVAPRDADHRGSGSTGTRT